mmetsp:Transcript_27008/g.49135  ORF Transcript_27008/g.49135 Transcript_27008/m.49135 type:complete len:245 (-) Transcript_27008:79-813(-)
MQSRGSRLKWRVGLAVQMQLLSKSGCYSSVRVEQAKVTLSHYSFYFDRHQRQRREVFGDGNDRESGDGYWWIHGPFEERWTRYPNNRSGLQQGARGDWKIYKSIQLFLKKISSGEIAKRKLQERLAGLKLIVIDEFSMLKQSDLYYASYWLKNIFNHKEPFAGVAVMLAGDPAQLSPVKGLSVWYRASKASDTHNDFGYNDYRGFTSVVELTENKRVDSQDPFSLFQKNVLTTMDNKCCTNMKL